MVSEEKTFFLKRFSHYKCMGGNDPRAWPVWAQGA